MEDEHSHARPGEPSLRVAMLAPAAGVYACYAWYLPFDAWWFLRFLMPALPVLFVLIAAGLLAVARPLAAGFRMLAMLAASVDWRYQSAGRHVRDHLPPNAVLLTMLHSGSTRYYSNRLTVRYDILLPKQADDLLAHLERRGYVPFALDRRRGGRGVPRTLRRDAARGTIVHADRHDGPR